MSSAVFYAIAKILEGPVHWSDQNFGYAIGIAILFVFVLAVLALIVLRFCISAYRNTLSRDALMGPENLGRSIADVFLCSLFGCFTGLWLAFSLSFVFSGVAVGVNFDVILSVLAGIAGIVILGFMRSRLGVALSSSLIVLSSVSFAASFQANRIIEQAELMSKGQAWCLATADFGKSITDVAQLGFFAMNKSKTYPHLGLWVKDDDGTHLVSHWSIRKQSFDIDTFGRARIAGCRPDLNYGNLLTVGAVEPGFVVFGDKTYRFPASVDVRGDASSLFIDTNVLRNVQGQKPKYFEGVRIVTNPRKPFWADNALPIIAISDILHKSADEFEYADRIAFQGRDRDGRQQIFLQCLSGPYEEQLCWVEVIEGTQGYNFYLPFAKLSEWSDSVASVLTVLEGFEVDETTKN